MKKLLIAMLATACLMSPCLAKPFYTSISTGVNINPAKINVDVPVNIGAEAGFKFGENIISISGNYFVNEKKNAPVFLNYKREVNTNLIVGGGIGTFLDSYKTPALSGSLKSYIDKNFFVQAEVIMRLEKKDRNNFLLFSVGYEF